MRKFKTCRFCGGFIPATVKSRLFCSDSCERAFTYYESSRNAREQEELSAFLDIDERRRKGERLCICVGCCTVFYSNHSDGYCSAACRKIYGPESAREGLTAACDAPSLHQMNDAKEAEMAALNRLKMRKNGI